MVVKAHCDLCGTPATTYYDGNPYCDEHRPDKLPREIEDIIKAVETGRVSLGHRDLARAVTVAACRLQRKSDTAAYKTVILAAFDGLPPLVVGSE